MQDNVPDRKQGKGMSSDLGDPHFAVIFSSGPLSMRHTRFNLSQLESRTAWIFLKRVVGRVDLFAVSHVYYGPRGKEHWNNLNYGLHV